MTPKQPLVRRIIIAFVLMTLVISGVFSLSIVAIVHYIEEQLVSEELAHELDMAIEYQRTGQRIRLPRDMHFFSSDTNSIPPQFSGLKDGFTEVVGDNAAFYALQRTEDVRRYLLVEDQSDFETREGVMFNGVLAGFILSLVAAWAVGWLVARRVIAPVIRLAEQVRHHGQLSPAAPALATEYAHDEVGQLAAAFDNTLGQLRLALEREHLFTSDVSHELRTPLMIIASSCELIREAGHLDAMQREQIARIARACEQMRDLVQTFLLLARASPSKSHMAGSISLSAAAEEQGKRWADSFAAKGLAFSVQVQEDGDENLYNATFLNTVMSNLLRNALHYTESGSVELLLEKASFSVKDSGIGIPPDQHEQIFRPFVRGRHAPGEGLGLGLSLVKRICEHEGWQVRVDTLSPVGSIFTVILKN